MVLSLLLLLLTPFSVAFTVNLDSAESIANTASTIAYNMMGVYTGNLSGQVPGLLPGSLSCNPNENGTYCWWEAGAMWGILINYWQYTGDSSYNSVVSQGLQFQRGTNNNYNPANQSSGMGVDDQLFWAFSVLDAVESNFPPPATGDPSWLSLAQGVFNFQASLWDTATCGGGFRWQVYSFNAGWNLKNTISNAGNFQLAARLAYITGNQSYAHWAVKVWDWLAESTLYEIDNSTGVLFLWDNTDVNNNCTDAANYVWSYNYGSALAGAAYMYNYTNGSSVWGDRVSLILNSTYSLFFPDKYGGDIMYELECEPTKNCNQDQKSFKAYLARWMAVTSLLVPSTATSIKQKLAASATGAAGQCDGGSSGEECGMHWWTTDWDGTDGTGQDMCALSVIGANLLQQNMAPLTLRTGATSKSNPSAGSTNSTTTKKLAPIGVKDKIGAAILTFGIGAGVIAGSVWLVM
ncbi:hypothetical protein DV736_g5827, partial [Chaetothyriales sp. CBS 134916]